MIAWQLTGATKRNRIVVLVNLINCIINIYDMNIREICSSVRENYEYDRHGHMSQGITPE